MEIRANLGKRLCALGVVVVVAMSFNPAFAFASVTAGEIAQQPAKQVSSQAKMKSVYVITGEKVVEKNAIQSITTTRAYTYNSRGLVAKSKEKNKHRYYDYSHKDTDSIERSFVYNKDGKLSAERTKALDSFGKSISNRNFFYGRNGLLKKDVETDSSCDREWTNSYVMKSGRVVAVNESSVAKGQKPTTQYAMKYAYKKGKVASRSDSRGSKEYFTYDKWGNISKRKLIHKVSSAPDAKTESVTRPYKNTYKNGHIAKRAITYSPTSRAVHTYTYKKIMVKSSLASKAQAQQWAIVNLNLNLAIGFPRPIAK